MWITPPTSACGPTTTCCRASGCGSWSPAFRTTVSSTLSSPTRHPQGSRFNGPDRGAWYGAFELETSQAEVIFHRNVALAEIGWWEDSATYDDYLVDISAELHDLREEPGFADYLSADSYVTSQLLAGRLLDQGSLGVVYPSVRRAGGNCVACFRPALVWNVRRRATYQLTWSGTPPTVGLAQA